MSSPVGRRRGPRRSAARCARGKRAAQKSPPSSRPDLARVRRLADRTIRPSSPADVTRDATRSPRSMQPGSSSSTASASASDRSHRCRVAAHPRDRVNDLTAVPSASSSRQRAPRRVLLVLRRIRKMTPPRAASGSAHHQPNAALSRSPASTTIDRQTHADVCAPSAPTAFRFVHRGTYKPGYSWTVRRFVITVLGRG